MAQITHAKTITIPDPTQADLDAQIALGNYPPGTVLNDIALPSDYNNNHVLTLGEDENFVTDAQLLLIDSAIQTPAGNDREVQYNDTGSLGASANFTFDANNRLNITATSLGVTINDTAGALLTNTTAAAAGTQQRSPGLILEGQGWKTNATADSQSVKFMSYVLPVQGSANPTGNYIVASSVNGSAYTTRLTLTSAGALSVGDISAANINALSVDSTTTLSCTRFSLAATSTDGVLLGNPSSSTAGVPVQYSPRIRWTGSAWDTGASASRQVKFIAEMKPTSGNPGTGRLAFSYDYNSGGFSEIVSFDASGNITAGTYNGNMIGSGNTSGTNTGDQTSIVGITGTKAQFDTACTDGNFVYSGDNVSSLTNDAGYISATTGDWTGTFDGQEGTYYLDRANHTGTQLLATISDVTASAAEVNVLDGITATTAELNYTDGVTSAIQTQLNGKQATITGGATTIATSNLTFSRALVSDASGKVAVSATTSTQLGYLSTTTSDVQTQINAKFTLPALTNGSILFSNGSTISQDNANLFYDGSSKRLGIGTSAPGATLSLFSTDTFQPQALIHASNDTIFGGYVNFRKQRLTGTTNVVGDNLGTFVYQGYDSSGTPTLRNAAFLTALVEAVGSGYVSAGFEFNVVNTSGTILNALLLRGSDGQATIPTTALIGNTVNPSATQAGTLIRTPAGGGTLISCGSNTALINMMQFQNGNGVVGTIRTTGTATQYNTSSGAAFKLNVRPMDDAGAIIDALNPVKYEWNSYDNDTGWGVIAEDAHEVFPVAVSPGTTDPEIHPFSDEYEPWGVDYSKFVPLLLAEVKALRARVAILEGA